jgi:phasin family protein
MANSSNNFNNPFMDAFTKMFTDGSMMSANKMMPMFDMNKMASMQRQNAEMMSAVGQAMTEGMQTMMQMQAKKMQADAADMFQLVKEVAISPNPETGMAKGAAFAKHSFENTMSNISEMSEMSAKAGKEIFEMVSKRMSDSMADCGSVSMCSSKKKAAAA